MPFSARTYIWGSRYTHEKQFCKISIDKPDYLNWYTLYLRGFPGGSGVKNPPANAGDVGLIPESGGYPSRRWRWQPTPVFLPGNPTDRRAWQAAIHEVAELNTTEQLSTCRHIILATTTKSLQSCPTLCDPIDGPSPGSPPLGFSRQEHWSRLPFPSPMHESEKWKWSRSVVSDS